MLFVVVGIELLLHDDVILRGKHVELRVLEDFVWVLRLRLPFLGRLLLVRLLFEDEGLLVELALEFGRLGIEPVVEGQFLAQ